jgi:hypothetical protein
MASAGVQKPVSRNKTSIKLECKVDFIN